MKEKPIEEYLRTETESLGCWCRKWVSPGTRGVPDRLVFIPGNFLEIVETKSSTGIPEPLQRSVHKILGKMGFGVWTLNSKEQVDFFVIYLIKKYRLLC